VFIVGLAAILFCVGLLKIKWNNYRFKKLSMGMIVAAFCLMTLYQGIMIFGFEDVEKFFPYSAFFLNFNVIILAVLIFLSQKENTGDMGNMINQAFPKTGNTIDPNREVNMAEEIEE